MAKQYQGVQGPRSRRHKDGTYSFLIDYYLPRPGQPVTEDDRIRETVRTKSKAAAAATRDKRMKGKEPTGKAQRQEDATVPGFAPRYLDLILPSLTTASSRRSRSHVVEGLVHYFSDRKACGHRSPRPMEQLRATDVQAFVNFRQDHQRSRPLKGREWIARPTTARTVALDVRILKHMYAVAFADGVVSAEAKERVASFGRRLSGTKMPAIPKPGDPGDRARFLHPEEVDRLLAEAAAMAEEHWTFNWYIFPVVYLALRTGIRKGGVLGMEESRVDLDALRLRDVQDKGREVSSQRARAR